MRIAENAAGELVGVRANLRLGVQAAAGVVEVDVAFAVKTAVVPCTKIVDCRGGPVLGIAFEKRLNRSNLNHFSIVGRIAQPRLPETFDRPGATGSSGRPGPPTATRKVRALGRVATGGG